MNLHLQYLWDEEKTKRLFKAFLIMMIIGSSAALVFTATYHKFSPHNLFLSSLIVLLISMCVVNLALLNRFDSRIKFLIFLLITQVIAAIFMSYAGGFLGIFQFGPYLLLIFSLFELGEDATMALGVFAIATFAITLVLTSIVNPHPDLLTEFLYYTIAYTVVLIIERGIGKELSLQIEGRRKLEQVDEMKNQFIALSSHYLRTPLTIIKAFSQGLDPKTMNEDQSKKVALFKSSIEQLEQLIEKFLLISEIQRGDLKLILTPTSLNRLVENLYREFGPLAAKSKVRLEYQDFKTEVKIQADYIRLKEALAAILDNSIQYNRTEGSVKMSLNIESPNAIIKVIDTGQGIDQEQIDVLFDPFNKGGIKNVLIQDKPGMGLSLYLAKLIIEAHKGKIEVQSTPTKGSEFSIILPQEIV